MLGVGVVLIGVSKDRPWLWHTPWEVLTVSPTWNMLGSLNRERLMFAATAATSPGGLYGSELRSMCKTASPSLMDVTLVITKRERCNYPPGNEHIPPGEKEIHLQICLIRGDMLVRWRVKVTSNYCWWFRNPAIKQVICYYFYTRSNDIHQFYMSQLGLGFFPIKRMKDFQFSLLEWSILLFTEEIRLDVPSGYHENVKDATHTCEKETLTRLWEPWLSIKRLYFLAGGSGGVPVHSHKGRPVKLRHL